MTIRHDTAGFAKPGSGRHGPQARRGGVRAGLVIGPRGQGNAKIAPKDKTALAEPPLYTVMLLNDDYTPRAFVVMVLEEVFAMGHARAEQVMMVAHKSGMAACGTYAREIAEALTDEANGYGAKFQLPLRFDMRKD